MAKILYFLNYKLKNGKISKREIYNYNASLPKTNFKVINGKIIQRPQEEINAINIKREILKSLIF